MPKVDPIDFPRARAFVITLWLAIVLCGVSIVLALGSDLLALAGLTFFDTVMSIICLRLFRRANSVRVVKFFLWTLTLTLSVGALATTPIELTNLNYLIVIPLVAAMMLDGSQAVKWFWRVIFFGALTTIAGHHGFTIPHVDPLPVVTRVMNFAGALTCAMALLMALSRERERSLVRTQEAERAKSAFFANVGHELRTPMNGVLGMADALLQRDVAPEEREMIETIRSSGAVLLSLLDDLLDLSKLEAKKLAVHPEPVALGRFFGELAPLWTPLAAKKGLTLAVDIDASLPAAAQLDPVRIRQVLNNLISNAIKFTQQGTARVEVRRVDDQLVCSVTDTGVGISVEDQSRLFGRFVQADDARARRFQGAGLGLFLSRQLATQMGGTLGVTSTAGVGSTFELRVPCVPCEVPVRRDEVTRLPRSLRVLVVDDNAVNRLVAQRLLDRTGCTVQVAGDGKSALDALEASDFDVVLMDVHMPEMDGLEATRLIRARSRRSQVAIVGVSASAAAEDIDLCRQSGMDDFLAKPVTSERLLATLRRFS